MLSKTGLEFWKSSDLQINVGNWKLFLFHNQNICCGCSIETSQWDGSFEHPKHMFRLLGKKIIVILCPKCLLNWTYDLLNGHSALIKWKMIKEISQTCHCMASFWNMWRQCGVLRTLFAAFMSDQSSKIYKQDNKFQNHLHVLAM